MLEVEARITTYGRRQSKPVDGQNTRTGFKIWYGFAWISMWQSIGRGEGVHHPTGASLNRMPLLDGVHLTQKVEPQLSCICHSEKRSVIESRLGAAE